MSEELIKITTRKDGVQCVSARELHEGLGVEQRFNDWISRRIKKYSFVENEDYTCLVKKRETRRKDGQRGAVIEKDYIITTDMAKELCVIERRNEKSQLYLKYLLDKDDVNMVLFIKEQPRKEYEFGVMLEEITGFHFIRQYPIDNGKYRLDFMLETENLIIEYDEEHHKYQKRRRRRKDKIL